MASIFYFYFRNLAYHLHYDVCVDSKYTVEVVMIKGEEKNKVLFVYQNFSTQEMVTL